MTDAAPRRPMAGALALLLSLSRCSAEEPREVRFGAPEELLAAPAGERIRTANVRADSLSGQGAGVLVSEGYAGVLSLSGCEERCSERRFSEGLKAPVRAHAVDMDGDGLRDLLVADIGSLRSDESLEGRVVLLQADGQGAFASRVLAEGLGRVACAEPGDLDGDGDIDVVGCAFGNTKGEIFWLERGTDGAFARHTIDPLAGAIHAFAFDADGDGDLDIAAILSQTHEQVNLYRNDGPGVFSKETLFQGDDACYGLSGLSLHDLDHDGDVDLLFTNGDDTDEECLARAYGKRHGVAWLENDGHGRFGYHDLLRFYGAYAAQAADLDGDGDEDVVVASYQDPSYSLSIEPSTLVWLENDGHQDFQRREIPGAPAGIITLDVVDIEGDGDPDLLTGSLELENAIPGAHRLALLRNLR